MRIGLGVLGLPPAAFWAMTTPELTAALEGWREARGLGDEARAPVRAELEDMMRRFPD